MADIALYVAEDFMERNSSMKERGGEVLIAAPIFSVLAHGVHQLPLKEVGKKGSELARTVLEPKSQFGLVASEGFFSA
ncbi:hypothetical protein AAC387_Pa07g0096 [Persea americana]